MDKIKIEINNKKYEIIHDKYFETWDLNDESILIIDKQQLAQNIINDLAENNIVDDSALDEAIWNLVDDIGGEIKSIAYSYADNNNIDVEDFCF